MKLLLMIFVKSLKCPYPGGLKKIMRGNGKKVLLGWSMKIFRLVTKIKNPHEGQFIDWWLLYKRDGKVYIQNQWLFREYYEETIGSENFTVENGYTFIRPYQSGLPDDTHISEWVVELR